MSSTIFRVLWQDPVTCCITRAQQLAYYSFLLYFVALTTINCIKNAVIEYALRNGQVVEAMKVVAAES